MPVHREKEAVKARPPRREASTSRTTGERPIITQNKPSRVQKTEPERKVKRNEAPKSESRKSEAPRARYDRKKPVESKDLKQTLSQKREETQRLRTRTRTLSPTEIKQLTKERIAMEYASAVATEPAEPEESEKEEEAAEEYEDDFEDYESDFEEESEEDQESKPDATRPTEPEAPEPIRKTEMQRREIEEIKRAMKMENELTKSRRSSPDIPDDVRHVTVLDFSKFTKKGGEKKVTKAGRRGRDLLSMITLDVVAYNFLDVPSVPYEVYMKMYGRSDTKQVYVQTNEDDLCEETQTDVIEVSNKWVQKPPEGSSHKYRLTKEERLGVGGDDAVDSSAAIQVIDTTRLGEFLSWASDIILPVLQDRRGTYLGVESLPNRSPEMHFSDGFVSLDVSEVPFLREKSVTNLFCVRNDTSTMLSVHTDPKSSFGESIIGVWNMNDVSRPMKLLTASNKVTAVSSVLQGLVFAGLSDGTLCLWDLKESSALHQATAKSGLIFRSATYSTAFLSHGHCSAVVSIQVMQESREPHVSDFAPLQISSLEERGTIIIWSVVLSRNLHSDEDPGLAHWGKVKLVKSSEFSALSFLGKDLPLYVTCNDLALEQSGDVEMYVANSMGWVTHVSRYGTPMKPKVYRAADASETTCLEMCPFDGNYFLVGHKDGSIRSQELPLMSLNGEVADDGPQASIVSLAWLLVRPLVFFALDSLSRIHVWNLAVSDMYPEVTIKLPEKTINCVKLIQSNSAKTKPHLVVATEEGAIEIHRLKDDFSSRSQEEIRKDVKKFLKYVSIL